MGVRGWPIVAAIAVLLNRVAAAQTVPPPTELPAVDVIGSSPLIGSGVDRNTIPAQSQALDSKDLSNQGTPNLTGALNQQVSGVSLDSASGNPYQPTFFYHGYAASPLQGPPQGLAVYVNGVRFNQPFGDTVDWDLLPDSAIDKLNLEGSNPVFGLNALGGSVNVELKDGSVIRGSRPIRPAARSGRSRASSSMASAWATPQPMSRAMCCTRMAGAICNHPTCRISMATLVGVGRGRSCISM